MLSYRHAFHAGNHADVLKHFVFGLVLQYFNQKDKPYWVIDTHAGAGIYGLQDAFAQKNGEFKQGIAQLLAANNLPEPLIDFCQTIQSFNLNNDLDVYPGSPTIAQYYCRADDKLRLFELHPEDFTLLTEQFAGDKKQTKIEQVDGFKAIKACLPPPTKRAITLIDPPYELKEDYTRVVTCIKDSLKRFSTGTYLVWYPLLQREEPADMLSELFDLGVENWLNVTLSVSAPSENGFGMFGSGMFIINPPWTLPTTLADTMPILTRLLQQDDTASFTLDDQIK